MLTSTLTYDPVNRITGLGTVNGASSPVAAYNYIPLGLTGIKTQASEAFLTNSGADSRNVAWSYDNIYRLTQEQIADTSGNNGAVNYVLDSVGNRTQQTSSIPSIPSINTIQFTVDDLIQTESYDPNGNTTLTGGKSFTYDSENHLVSLTSGAVSLVYDGDGNRVAKTLGGVTTQYLVDDLNPTGYAQVVDELTGGVVSRTYTFGLQRIDEEQIVSGSWTPSFYGYDGGGSVRQLTNAVGAVTDTYNYDAFGNLLNPAGATTPNNYRYRGEQYDPDLNLYYLRARYYNPATGRFMSRDPEDGKPLDPRTLHKYLYASGDPINLFDPTGRATFTNPNNRRLGDALVEYAEMANNVILTLYNFKNYIVPVWWSYTQNKLIAVAVAELATQVISNACNLEALVVEAWAPPGSKSKAVDCVDTPAVNNGVPILP